MKLSDLQVSGLNIAINEARLVNFGIEEDLNCCRIRLATLSVDEYGNVSNDMRLTLCLSPIGRVAVSYRHGFWNDPEASVERVSIQELPEVVRSFGGAPIYGADFIDAGSEAFTKWADRLSIDERNLSPIGLEHTLTLFQEDSSPDRHLDVWIWFDNLLVLDPNDQPVSIENVIADGVRWWGQVFDGDQRMAETNIFPLKREER